MCREAQLCMPIRRWMDATTWAVNDPIGKSSQLRTSASCIFDIFGGCLAYAWQDTMPPAEVFVPALVCCPPQCGCMANGWMQLIIDIFVALGGFPAEGKVLSVGCARSTFPSWVVRITGAACDWAKICTTSQRLSVLVFDLSLTRLLEFITGRRRHDWWAQHLEGIAGELPQPWMSFIKQILYNWIWLVRRFGLNRAEIKSGTGTTCPWTCLTATLCCITRGVANDFLADRAGLPLFLNFLGFDARGPAMRSEAVGVALGNQLATVNGMNYLYGSGIFCKTIFVAQI